MSTQALREGRAAVAVIERTLKTTAFNATGNPETEPRAVLELMTPVYWMEFAQWAGTRGNRPAEYLAVKQELQDAQMAIFYRFVPQCQGHVVFKESATPNTIEHFIAKTHGGHMGYLGLNAPIKPKLWTGVSGLTFAGSDVMTSLSCAAVTGTQAAGIALDNRNILMETIQSL